MTALRKRGVFLLVMLKNAPVTRRPKCGFLSCSFQSVICPRIAGIKKAVAASCIIKCIVVAVNSVCFYKNWFPCRIPVEFIPDETY